MNRRHAPRPGVIAKFALCGRVLQDDSPVTEFERRRHDQLVADEIARYEANRRTLFDSTDPEAA